MKRILLAATLAIAAVPAFAADVGVSVSIGQPGFYGQIDIGSAPRPQVIYTEPMVIERVVVGSPMYLRVPPGHSKNWRKHCYRYHACGRPVYFVRDSWYSRDYVPYYNKHHGGGRHESRRDNDRGGHHGKGNGKGHGNGKHGKGHD